MKHEKADAGFTLVEVLVSLALLSVLSIYALFAFRVQKDMDRIQVDIARKIEVRAAMETIRSQLEDMQRAFMPGESQDFKMVFEGHADRVTFASLSDGSRIEGGLYRTTFLVDENQRLVASFEAIKSNGFGPATSIAMLDGVTSLAISYAVAGAGSAPSAEWQKRDLLPKKIDFELVLENSKQPGAPPESASGSAIVQLIQ